MRFLFNANIYALILFSVLLTGFNSCAPSDKISLDRTDLNFANTRLLDAAMADVFTPPVASRIFAYTHLAHYLTYQSLEQEGPKDIQPQINGLSEFDALDKIGVDAPLAALLPFLKWGVNLFIQSTFLTNSIQSLLKKRY